VQIAPAVMKMVSEKVPRTIIAKRLAVNYETVQKAISWWHTSRGLPVPSGRPKPSGAAAEGPSDGADQAA